jgi:hypothetical protein
MNGKVFVTLVVVLAALAVSVTAVKDLDFALEYRGKCDYSADKSSANCHLKAQSQEVLTHIKYSPFEPFNISHQSSVRTLFYFFNLRSRGDGNVATSVRKLIGSVSNLDFFTNYNFTSYSWTSKGSLVRLPISLFSLSFLVPQFFCRGVTCCVCVCVFVCVRQSFGVHTTQKNHRLEFEDSSIGRINPYPYSYGFATSWKVTKGFGAFDQGA